MGDHGHGHGGLDIGIGVVIGDQRNTVPPPGAYGPEIFGPAGPMRPPAGMRPRDPVMEEARHIAFELDSARNDWQAQRAADHLRRDLMQTPDPYQQRRLVELVDRFDRKGVGADLMLDGRRGGSMDLWTGIRISPCYNRGPQPFYPRPEGPLRGVPVAPGGGVGISIDLNLFKHIR